MADQANGPGSPFTADLHRFAVSPATVDPRRGPAELMVEVNASVVFRRGPPSAPRPKLNEVAAYVTFRSGTGELPGHLQPLATEAAPLPSRPDLIVVPTQARYTLRLPELPVGKHVASCRIIERWPAAGGRALSGRLDAAFSLAASTSRPGPPALAIERTTLAAALAGARPGFVAVGAAMLPYMLKLAGVPTLSAFEPGVLRSGDPRTAGRVVLPVAAPVEKALHEMPAAALATTPFLPVLGLGGMAVGDPFNAARLGAAARGAMESAGATLDEARRLEGFVEAGKTALDAVKFDPHDLGAWATAAQAFALGRDGATAAELFFSLLFRMRTAERVLGVVPGPPELNPWWEAIARVYRYRLTWSFWPSFAQTVELLGLSRSGLDFDFPRLKPIGMPPA